MIFRRKPSCVEAEQFLEGKPLPFNERGPICCFNGNFWYVVTIHGQETLIEYGDWIILELKNKSRAYPCKPDVFEALYEKAE